METTYQTAWTPPAQMRDHRGLVLDPDTFFFASPPPEIGAVISAASGVGTTENLNQLSRTPILHTLVGIVYITFSSWLGFLITLVYLSVFASFSLVVIWFGFLAWAVLNSSGVGAIWAWLGGGLASVLLAWLFITTYQTPKAICSFVGELGVAYYWQTRKGIKGEVLRFSETMGLRKDITRIYRNGVYHKTSFNFTWNNRPFLSDQPTMRRPFSIAGASPNISTNDYYRFAQAAEQVWTVIRLQRAQAEFAQLGVARFSTAKGVQLEVGSGFINVVFPNREPRRIETHELELTTEKGKFQIRHKADEKLFGRFSLLASANVTFRSDEVDDLNAFLHLVETIVRSKS